MSIQDVVVTARPKTGKGDAKRLRRSGYIPAVVYGLGVDPSPVSVSPKAIGSVIRSEKGLNTVLNLTLEGTDESRHVMIKDTDRHPVTDRLMHVDFMRIDMEKKVVASIPIHFIGTPEGTKKGGILTIVRHEVEIQCLPKHLIGALEVNVTRLGLDDALRVGDLPQFDNVEYLLGPKRTVAVVHAEKVVVKDDEEEDGGA